MDNLSIKDILAGASKLEVKVKHLSSEVENLNSKKANLEFDISRLFGERKDLEKINKGFKEQIALAVERETKVKLIEVEELKGEVYNKLEDIKKVEQETNLNKKVYELKLEEVEKVIISNHHTQLNLTQESIEVDGLRTKLSKILELIRGISNLKEMI